MYIISVKDNDLQTKCSKPKTKCNFHQKETFLALICRLLIRKSGNPFGNIVQIKYFRKKINSLKSINYFFLIFCIFPILFAWQIYRVGKDKDWSFMILDYMFYNYSNFLTFALLFVIHNVIFRIYWNICLKYL